MGNQQQMGAESSAVQTHLQIMQDVIRRMAENSRSSKVWCVALVSATLILVTRTDSPHHALIALVPTLLLFVLDAYYLALERSFIKSYDTFVASLHEGRLAASAVYSIKPTGMGWKEVVWCFRSFSTLPFYAPLALTIVLAWLVFFLSSTD